MNFDASVPSAARVYDFFLGGKDNYAGIRQFLDIGPGLPTNGNVREVAQETAGGPDHHGHPAAVPDLRGVGLKP